ncbi:MAG: hypothetical protein U9Q15_03035 [Patescibacteria group bacterium]|nr:hypothetical protein [Patescibacteria group bacterium]
MTPVALLPLAFVGIDLKEVFHGYQISQSCCISSDIDQNRALQLAIYQYYLAQEKHLPMTVMMTYGTEISALGDWYAQLLGESIGKEGYGITPIPATGTTDQHSQLQLYQQGPDDKSYIFIGVDESKKDIQFDSTDNENWKYLENVCFHTAITAAQK